MTFPHTKAVCINSNYLLNNQVQYVDMNNNGNIRQISKMNDLE